MLYSNSQKVPLSDEISHISDYIELQKLRFAYKLCLTVNMKKPVESLQIAPLILIPLVENAFKHGDFTDIKYPAEIKATNVKNKFSSAVSNRKSLHKKYMTSGIGINNLKRRLKLIYPNSHHLEINETDICYAVKITINVENEYK